MHLDSDFRNKNILSYKKNIDCKKTSGLFFVFGNSGGSDVFSSSKPNVKKGFVFKILSKTFGLMDKINGSYRFELLTYKDENGQDLFKNRQVIKSLLKSSAEVQKNALQLAQLKDENGEKLFRREQTIQLLAEADEKTRAQVVSFAQIEDDNNRRLFTNETRLVNLALSDKDSCDRIADLLNRTDNKGKKIFSSEVAINSIVGSGNQTYLNALSFLDAVDEKGEKLFQNEWVIKDLSRYDEKTCRDLIELAKLKNRKGKRIFSDEKKLRELVKNDGNAANAALEIASFTDENNEKLFDDEYSIMKLSLLDEDIKKEALQFASLKDDDGRRLFVNPNVLIFLTKLTDNGKQTAVKLARLKDDNGKRLFSNEFFIFNLAETDNSVIDKACQLARLKDENNDRLFSNESLIMKLAQTDDNVVKNVINLAKLKNHNNERLFLDDFDLLHLAKRNLKVRQIAIKLASSADENNERLFKNTSLIAEIAVKLGIFVNNSPSLVDDFINICKLSCDGTKIFNPNFALKMARNHKNFDFEKSQKFINQNRGLISEILNLKTDDKIKNELLLRATKLNEDDFFSLTLDEKLQKIDVLQQIKEDDDISDAIKDLLNIQSDLDFLKNSVNHVITPTKTKQEDINRMFKGFFANNNPDLENTLKTSDFTIYGKQGLPLAYSKNEFLSDLDSVLSEMDENSKIRLLNKLQITELRNENDDLAGYNGVINLDFVCENEFEKKALDLAKKFILNNEIKTGSFKLDNALNSLIKGMPEFINVIGKTQHDTQDYSVDIHILTVLNGVLNNPNYSQLSEIDKTVIKLASIMHDIAKPQGVNDKNHPQYSALFAKDILDKYNLSYELKDRIFELVKNHHWLELYNTGQKDAEYIASLFRRKNDINIARIMTEADLKAVNKSKSFYNAFKSALEFKMQNPIDEALFSINSFGQMFLTSKIVNKSLIPVKKINNEEYQIIDFTQLPNDFDLSKYGFSPNTTPENLRLLVHCVDDKKLQMLEAAIDLRNPNYEGYLCASYISKDNKKTYCSNDFGVSLEAENVNISNAYFCNQGSGAHKTFSTFSFDLNQVDRYRKFISGYIKEQLELTDEEYVDLYLKIQKLKYVSQLDNISFIRIKNKELDAKKVKEAILNANQQMIAYKNTLDNNELNIYLPKVNALIAKVDLIDEIPSEMLDIAKKFNLPIFVLGS